MNHNWNWNVVSQLQLGMGLQQYKGANQTWLVIQHWWHGPMTVKQKFMPLALKNVMCPWHIELSHAPGTFGDWYSLYRRNKCSLSCMDRKSLYAAGCCLKPGSWVPVKCHMFSCLFSVREIDFHMTFEVGHWAAALCQPMVLLGGKLIAGW